MYLRPSANRITESYPRPKYLKREPNVPPDGIRPPPTHQPNLCIRVTRPRCLRGCPNRETMPLKPISIQSTSLKENTQHLTHSRIGITPSSRSTKQRPWNLPLVKQKPPRQTHRAHPYTQRPHYTNHLGYYRCLRAKQSHGHPRIRKLYTIHHHYNGPALLDELP